MNATKLKFNFPKSEFVVCAPKRHSDYKDLVLNINEKEVKPQLHARLLGLQISWYLTHTWYVTEMKDYLLAGLNQRLYVLRQLANKCPKKCVQNLAHGLIYSKFSHVSAFTESGCRLAPALAEPAAHIINNRKAEHLRILTEP